MVIFLSGLLFTSHSYIFLKYCKIILYFGDKMKHLQRLAFSLVAAIDFELKVHNFNPYPLNSAK